MIVCVCHAVCDKRIRQLAREGAGSVEEVSARCGAGTDCGSCVDNIAELIDEEDAGPRRLHVIHREAA
jgi:bacterioferritin-associated ferredoxin